MKHHEAPFRLYKKPNGKFVVWSEEVTEWNKNDTHLDKPPPNWKLLRGFTSEKTLLSYMEGRKLKIK